MIKFNNYHRTHGITFGICEIIDGIIRVISFGYLYTELPYKYSIKQISKSFKGGNQ